VVLCDRSVLDNYCYLVHAAGNVPVWERMLDHWLGTYDLLVHVPVWRRPSFDGVRAVDPSFQGRGLSKILLRATLDHARAAGLPMKLEVGRANIRAVDLYKKAGFESLGDYEVYIRSISS